MNRDPSRAGFGKREYEHNAMIAEEPEFYESFLEEPGLTQTLTELFPHQNRDCCLRAHQRMLLMASDSQSHQLPGTGEMAHLSLLVTRSKPSRSDTVLSSRHRLGSNYVEGRLREKKQVMQTNVRASQVASVIKNPPTSAGEVRDASSTPGSGRSPRGGHGNLLQYSHLKDPMDREACGL